MKITSTLLVLLWGAFISLLSAQDPCNSVEIVDVRYDAFSDTTLLVQVINNSSDIFSYPGFILYDTNGDTIAKETVFYFGIGQEHISEMSLLPDALIVGDTFQGTLELWTGFYTSLACTFEISEPLCRDTICHTLVFDLTNFGGALVVADYTYTIVDDLGGVQVSKAFSLMDTVQHYADTLCLPGGAYTLAVSTDDNPTGGQPYIYLYELISSFSASHVGNSINQASDTTYIPFVLYGKCPGIVNDTREPDPKVPLEIQWSQEGVWASTDEGHIRQLSLYDLAGRQVAIKKGPASNLFIPSDNLRGLFIAHVVLDAGAHVSKKVYFGDW